MKTLTITLILAWAIFWIWYWIEIIKPVKHEQTQTKPTPAEGSQPLFDTVDPWDSTEAQGLDDLKPHY